MYRLEKSFTFEASHRLPLHDGKCRRLHGHSWRGVAVCEGEALHVHGPKTGMLIDYGDVKAAVAKLLENFLDHHHLNDTTGLENPTSEHLARWVYDALVGSLPYLVAVRIEETCTSSCEYRPAARAERGEQVEAKVGDWVG